MQGKFCQRYFGIDTVVLGEGEIVFPQLVHDVIDGKPLPLVVNGTPIKDAANIPCIRNGTICTFRLPDADFSGMDGDRDLYIFAVAHKALVDVQVRRGPRRRPPRPSWSSGRGGSCPSDGRSSSPPTTRSSSSFGMTGPAASSSSGA